MIRKALAGGLGALSLTVFIAGLVSFWHPLYLDVGRPPIGAFLHVASGFNHGVAFFRWGASVQTPPAAPPERFHRAVVWLGFKWCWQQDFDAGTYRMSDGTLYTVGYHRATCVNAPFWVVVALLAIYPLTRLLQVPYRRLRRRRAGLCIKCGYNLTGNVSGRCPECGAGVAAAVKTGRR